MVLTDAEEVDADLLGEDALFDDVPNRLGVGERAVLGVVGDVAEGVQPEDERELRLLVAGGERTHGSIRHGDQVLSVFDDVSTISQIADTSTKWR